MYTDEPQAQRWIREHILEDIDPLDGTLPCPVGTDSPDPLVDTTFQPEPV